MSTEIVRFAGSGDTQLSGRLEKPAGEPQACALFAHCFTCGKDLKAAVRISQELARRDIAVLRFDFTGLGESSGDFADTNFSSNLEDILAAAYFLRLRGQAPSFLIGHSLGGTAVLAAAGRLPEVKAVASLAAPADTQHLAASLESLAPGLQERGEAEIRLAGKTLRVRKQLLEDLNAHQMTEHLRDLNRPLMIMHSPSDQVVSIDHARRLYQAARHPKSFVALDQADHLLSNPADAQFVAAILATWTHRYI